MTQKLQKIEQLSETLNVRIDGILDNNTELANLKVLQNEGYIVEKKITIVYHPVQRREVVLKLIYEEDKMSLYLPFIVNKGEIFPSNALEAMLANAIKDLKKDNPEVERFCLVRGEKNTVDVYALYKNK